VIGTRAPAASGITSISFSPDGTLVTGTITGETLLWNLNASHVIQRICSTTEGSLTAQQWHQYIPQLPYLGVDACKARWAGITPPVTCIFLGA
jgi:WD40 repeat protein